MLYTLKLYNIMCQLYLSKTGEGGNQCKDSLSGKPLTSGQGDTEAERGDLLLGNQAAFCGSWG